MPKWDLLNLHFSREVEEASWFGLLFEADDREKSNSTAAAAKIPAWRPDIQEVVAEDV